MMPLLKLLKQPFPLETSAGRKLGMAAFFGLFVFGFLLFFKPFHLDQYPMSRLWWVAWIYGAITFGCIIFSSFLLPVLFPSVFDEAKWNTGKHILLVSGSVFFVGLVNYLLSPLLVDSDLSFGSAIWFQGITLAIALIPVTMFIVFQQNRLLRKFSEQAKLIERKLKEKQAVSPTNESIDEKKTVSNKIILVGDYQDEKAELYIDDLYFITTAGNYLKLYHLEKERLVYSLLRSTLKKAEPEIFNYPVFFKCHRAYIVNLDKVEHIEGNAQGYRLRIKGYDELVPVSRNLNAEFSDRLLAFRLLRPQDSLIRL